MTRFILIAILVLTQPLAFAGPIDQGIAYQGLITKTNGVPLENAGVIFKFQIVSPGAEDCVLYDEEQTVDMTNSQGVFNLTVGKGTASYSGNQNPTPQLSLSSLFDNSQTRSGLTCTTGTSYTPAPSDVRKLKLSFNDGTSWTNVPAQTVTSAPFAEHAYTLQGLGPSSFIQVNSATAALTQPNIESVFNSQDSVTELAALIAGQSAQYIKSSGGTATFSSPPVSATAPTASNQLTNKGYTDSSIAGEAVAPAVQTLGAADAGKDLVWNGTQWTAQSAPVSGINALTGDVTASGTGSAVATISPSAVTDAKIATGISASKISVGTLPLTVIPGLSATQITAGVFPMSRGGTGNGSITGINQLISTDGVSGTTMTSMSCASGQTISFNALGAWTCVNPSSGSVTSVSAGTGLTGGTITSAGTISIDTSVVALQTDSRLTNSRPPNGSATGDLSGSYPAPTVSKIQGIAVKTGTPASNQVLQYNSANSDWEATTLAAGNAGTVTSVSASAPLSISNPSTTPALSISQATTSTSGYLSSTDWTTFNSKVSTTDSRLAPAPAVGSALSMIRINSAGTAYETQTPAQVVSDLGLIASFDASGAAATAQAASLQKSTNLSDLTNVATARTNLGLGSAAVLTAGTATNNVVQYSAPSKLPAVDGSALLNLNASSVSSGTLSMARGGTGSSSISGIGQLIVTDSVSGSSMTTLGCTSGQTISYSPSTGWGCYTLPVGNAGTVTSVSAGNGLSGSPITSSGALAVDFTKVAALSDSRFSPAPVVGSALSYVRMNSSGTGYEVRTTLQMASDLSLGSASLLTAGAAAGNVVQLDSNAHLPAVDGSALTNLSIPNLSASKITSGVFSASLIPSGTDSTKIPLAGGTMSGALTLSGDPTAALGAATKQYVDSNIAGSKQTISGLSVGQTLQYSGPASGWVNVTPSGGSVTSITTGTGLTGGTITSSGTIAIDSSIVALQSDSRFTNSRPPNGSASGDLSGSFPSPSVAKIQGIAVKSGTPSGAQVLQFNSANNDWEASTLPVGNVGTVTSITPGSGFASSTPITSSGTLNVNVGTGANQIVQMSASGKLPAMDGSALTDLNASSVTSGILPITRGGTNSGAISGIGQLIVTDPVTGTSMTTLGCLTNQTISYSATGWGCFTLPTGNAGTVTSITAGTGLSGGTITGTGTIALTPTAVTANPYGSATQVPTFTVNAYGQLTAAANVTISGVTPGGAAGGDLTGTYPNPTVSGINGKAVTITALATNDRLKYNSTSATWVNSPIASSEVTTALGYTPINPGQMPTNCASNQTLTFSSPTGTWACSTISLSATQVTGVLAATNMPQLIGDVTSAAGTNSTTVQKLQGSNLAIVAINNGQYLRYNGSSIANSTLLPGDFGSQTAATVLAAPSGAAGASSFRSLVSTDIPSLDASKITTGVFGAGQVPSGTDSTKLPLAGGTMSGALNMGGNSLFGSSTASTNLILDSTSSATKGNIILAPSGGGVAIGISTPSTALDMNGALSLRGISAPALAPAGQGRIYYDSTSNSLQLSQNGGAYSPLAVFSSVMTAGTYGDASHFAQMTVDSFGRVTAVTLETVGVGSSISANTSIGYGAMPLPNSGGTNTAYGYNALNGGPTGNDNTAIGALSQFVNNSGAIQNTSLGSGSLQNNTASGNTAIGYKTLNSNTTGGNNTAVGTNALASGSPGTGGNNTAVGYGAAQSTSGGNTSAFGAGSLQSNTTGSDNSAFGDGTLSQNLTGKQNTSVGSIALGNSSGDSNTAVGYKAAYSNTAGTQGTAIGAQSLQSATGSQNVGVGYMAGYSVTTGTKNTILGGSTNLGTGISTGSNNIIIGYDIYPQSPSANGQINIGGLIYGAAGKAGVGVPAPQTALDVAGGISIHGTTFTATGCTNSTLVGGSTAGSFKAGLAGTCTITITMGNTQTASNGWSCWVNDLTTPANTQHQTATTTTTVTFSGTTVLNDTLNFGCVGY